MDLQVQNRNLWQWLQRLELLGRWIVALIFFIAAIPKLFNVSEFAAIINAYEILPHFLLLPTAVLLPIIEIVLAVGLLFNKLSCKVGAFFLLLMFIVVLSYAIYQGLDIDCGCFGPEDPEHKAFHGLRVSLVRDIVMVVLLVISWAYHHYYHHHRSEITGD